MDVLVGFEGGEILWIDPFSFKYTMINRGTAVTKSPIRQIKWIPHHDTLLCTAHDDGCVYIWDVDLDEQRDGAVPPDPGAAWDPNLQVVATSPQGVLPSSPQRRQRGKEAIGPANPIAHWRVARAPLTGLEFCPTQPLLAVTSEDGCLRLIDVDQEM